MITQLRLSSEQSTCILKALAPFEAAVIYIFGSFGTATQHPKSDIDIAFLPTLPALPLDYFYIASELSSKLGHPVDLINLKQASTVLAKEVLLTGTPLLVNDSAIHQQFEMLTLTDYARFNEERHSVLSQ
jgi:uncharacterized protein